MAVTLHGHAVEEAMRRGYASMRLYTPERQARARRFYEREGWTVASTGNERSGEVDTTVVRYPDSDLEATAAAVAASLGDDVEAVLDDDAEGGSVTVVAGTDQVG